MTPAALLLLALSLAVFLLVRIAPVLGVPRQGCDAYYFLLSAKAWREQRRLPVVLPDLYLADIREQWYPPGFTLLLGLMPEGFLKRNYWLINYLLDGLNLVVMDLALWTVSRSVPLLIGANLLYTFTPVANKEYFTMTSRSLGNLLFSLYILALYAAMVPAGTPIRRAGWALLASVVWFMILMSHKLTMQLGLVLSAALALAYRSWLPAAVAFGGLPLAVLLTGGYYFKLLKGHWDIVSFWHRNLPWLGAHQVHDSPIYGGKKACVRQSLPAEARRLASLTAYNPGLLFALYLLAFRPFYLADYPLGRYLALCLAVIAGWGLATTLIPYLKALGEGYRYIKYAGFPSAAVIAMAFRHLGWAERGALAGLLALSLWSMWQASRHYRRGEAAAGIQDRQFEELIAFLRRHPEVDRIGCLSAHLCDPIAFHAGRKVLWGTHHYLFNEKIVKFFPVLRAPLEELAGEYDLGYWIVNADYVDPAEVGLAPGTLVATFGRYGIYRAC